MSTHLGQQEGQRGGPIALLELSSIAIGHLTLDALLKQADVELLAARPVSPGRWIILFTGSVDDVTSALRRGVEVAGAALVDRLFIPDVDARLLALAAGQPVELPAPDALGTIETLTVASAIVAGDVAAKTASISPLSVGLARGLGGKCWVTFCGELSDVSAAVDAGAGGAAAAGLLVERVLIPRPDERMFAVLSAGIPLA